MMKVMLCAIGLLMTVNVYADEPIKLESQFVGDKEQPAVSYFMSWQGPGSTENLYRKEEDKYEKNIEEKDAHEFKYTLDDVSKSCVERCILAVSVVAGSGRHIDSSPLE